MRRAGDLYLRLGLSIEEESEVESTHELFPHFLHAVITREELLGLPQGTRVAHVRLMPVACLGLWLGLSTRDELINAEILKNS